jgi:hypothetical protein
MMPSPIKNIDLINDLYRLNETGKGGYFPIGVNNCWHGGIHFRTNNPVTAMLNGQLFAYRIPEKCFQISLKEILGRNEYKQIEEKRTVVFYNNELINEYECYEEAVINNVPVYRIKDEYKRAYKKGSNGFMLLQHKIRFPTNDGQPFTDFSFFSLYMHLAPNDDLPFSVNFMPITLIEKLPTLSFYYRWRFRLASNIDLPESGKYGIKANKGSIEGEEKVLLKGSYFVLAEPACYYADYNKSGEKVNIKVLDNPQNDDLSDYFVESAALDIKDETILLKKKTEEVALYRTRAPDINSLEKYFIGKAAGDSRFELINNFKNANDWRSREKIIEARVNNPADIRTVEGLIPGGILPAGEPRGNISADCFLIKLIRPNDLTKIQQSYRIITASEYYSSFGNGTPGQEIDSTVSCDPFVKFKERDRVIITGPDYKPEYRNDQFVLIIKQDCQGIIETSDALFKNINNVSRKYLFTYSGKLMPVHFVNSIYKASALYNPNQEAISTVSSNLVIFEVDYQNSQSLFAGDIVEKIDSGELADIEGTWKVKYKTPENSTHHYYIKADDTVLHRGPRGILQFTERSKRRLQEEGLVIYTDSEGLSCDIARDILGVSGVNNEFSINNPVENMSVGFNGKVNIIKKNGVTGFILNPPKDYIEVKAELSDGFEIKDAIQYKDISIAAGSIMGYAGTMEDVFRFFHFGLFFKQDLPGNFAKNYYFIRRSEFPIELYNYKEIEKSGTIYLPKDTVLKIEEPSDSSQMGIIPFTSAAKVSIKEIFVYIRFDDINSLDVKNQKCTINQQFKYWVIVYTAPHNIYFDNNGETENECTLLKERLFLNGDILRGKTFWYSNISDNGNWYNIKIQLDEIRTDGAAPEEWTFWIKCSNYSIKDGIIKLISNINLLEIYDENPEILECSPVSLTPSEPVLLLDNNVTESSGRTDGNRDERFYQINKEIDGGGYLIKKSDLEKYKKDTVDWADFFDIRQEDGTEDIICDIKDVLENAAGGGGNVANAAGLAAFFENQANQQAVLRLRRMLCKFPFEFNKGLYEDTKYKDRLDRIYYNTDDDAVERVKSIMNELDVWDSIKEKPDFSGASSLWHGHPVYTLDVFDKLGLTEFNPYIINEPKDIRNNIFEVKDNPGFAPLAHKKDGKTMFEFAGEKYASITGLFNEDYTAANPQRASQNWTYYWHEGVDFAGYDGGMPIKCFINGKIVASGINIDSADRTRGMGGCLVVQDLNDIQLYYVLVHMDEYERDKKVIFPGNVVGTVGRDLKHEAGFHLHLTHIKTKQISDVYNLSGDEIHFPFWTRGVTEETGRRVLNPFDHNITWKGRGYPR